ncbi:hypothetical protein HZA42_05090 [Candidatus Peregrinibacteria bacterium]|nr:hypothetical protein [Candidatus Peregrinibacteria bacterium]
MKISFKIILFLAVYSFFAQSAFGRVLVLTDDANFQEMVSQKSDLASECEGSPSGETCLQVQSKKFYEESIEGWNFPIKQKPVEENEYRYILFAWKQQGGKSLMMQLANNGQWGTALSYVAGNPGNTYYKIDVSPQSPSDWNVVVRDVYKDMVVSQFEKNFNHNSSLRDIVITGIALTPWDGEYGMWDKIILGTDKEELLQMAEELNANLSEDFYDPLDTQKEQWNGYIYASYDWERVSKGFSKIERKLKADGKRFFARDVALANAWLFLDSAMKGESKKALSYYSKAQKYLKTPRMPPDPWGLVYLKDLLTKKKNLLNKTPPRYVQKVALVVIPAVITDNLEDAFDEGEYRKFLLEWDIVKAFIEKNTGGKMSIKTKLFLADGASFRGLTGDGKVDITQIEPYPEDILAEADRDFDVIVYYSPTLTVSSGGVDNSTKKGILVLNRGHSNPDDFILPLHELVHVYERFFNIGEAHVFRKDPTFSKKPLQVEFSYYENFFRNLLPNKIKDDFQDDWSALNWHQE